MHGGQLADFLLSGDFFPFGATHVDQVSRALRKADLLPLGGRGPHAAQISLQHAANMLLGLLAPTAAAAPVFVDEWSRMQSVGKPFRERTSFGDALIEVLATINDPGVALDRIDIAMDFPRASIITKDGDIFLYGLTGVADAKKSKWKTYACWRSFVFRSSVLSQLSMKLAPPKVITRAKEDAARRAKVEG